MVFSISATHAVFSLLKLGLCGLIRRGNGLHNLSTSFSQSSYVDNTRSSCVIAHPKNSSNSAAARTVKFLQCSMATIGIGWCRCANLDRQLFTAAIRLLAENVDISSITRPNDANLETLPTSECQLLLGPAYEPLQPGANPEVAPKFLRTIAVAW